MRCRRIGWSPTGISGLGTRVVASWMRSPRPPQKSTTFISEDLHGGDRDDEAGAPLARVGELLDDLRPQVPGQDEDVVGPRLGEALGRLDRDVGAGQPHPLLIWIAVDGVLEKVGADPAVVEERVALSGGAVARDDLALSARADEELEEVSLERLDPRPEALVALHAVEAMRPLELTQRLDAR